MKTLITFYMYESKCTCNFKNQKILFNAKHKLDILFLSKIANKLILNFKYKI